MEPAAKALPLVPAPVRCRQDIEDALLECLDLVRAGAVTDLLMVFRQNDRTFTTRIRGDSGQLVAGGLLRELGKSLDDAVE